MGDGKVGDLMPEPIEPMTPEKWAALEAGYAILSETQEDLDRVPRKPVDWSACGAAATLIVESFPSILAYHKKAEEIRQAAKEVISYGWGISCMKQYHDMRISAMQNLRTALVVNR